MSRSDFLLKSSTKRWMLVALAGAFALPLVGLVPNAKAASLEALAEDLRRAA